MNDSNLPESQPYIALHLSSKGRYSWDIKVDLSTLEKLQNNENVSSDSNVVVRLNSIDQLLRSTFANNTAELKNTSSFKNFMDSE